MSTTNYETVGVDIKDEIVNKIEECHQKGIEEFMKETEINS